MKKMTIMMKKINPTVLKCAKWAGITIVVLFLLYAFFFLLPLTLPFLKEKVFHVSNIDKLGQMGDSYGIFNALFSGFAFIGVLVTLYLQSRDNRKRTIVEQYYQMLEV